MGQNKALMPFLGEPLLFRIQRRLAALAQEVLVTAHAGSLAPPGAVVVPDRYPQLGPLGGLLSGLQAAGQPVAALVGCDMPFASLALFQAQLALLEESGCDIVVPRSPDGLEPLHAVYRRAACLPAVQRAVESGRLRMVGWYAEVRVLEMPLEEVARLDPGFRAFINVNTPEEFASAESLSC
jgi:molybdopterin-guanine dinucleotide biosynthesis protein A